MESQKSLMGKTIIPLSEQQGAECSSKCLVVALCMGTAALVQVRGCGFSVPLGPKSEDTGTSALVTITGLWFFCSS